MRRMPICNRKAPSSRKNRVSHCKKAVLPVPFHDAEDIAELGAAAFLHMLPSREGAQRLGALLFINARGEPLEFAYNRIELMQNMLWRAADQQQAAARRLALSLFEAVTLVPALLLCRADVIGPHLFGAADGLSLCIPVGRLAAADESVGYLGSEEQVVVETIDDNGECHDTHLFWTPAPPSGAAATLFEKLVARNLLLEPFTRAEKGLREVYGEQAGARL